MSVLDVATYESMMQAQGAIYEEMRAALEASGAAGDPPPALAQVQAGRAESPAWFLVQATEFDPEPLTVANLRVRDVYGAPRMVGALLDLMASARWLEHDGADAYTLAEAGRGILQRARRRREAMMPLFSSRPAAEIEDLTALLDRLIAASLSAPTPPGTWCLAHSRRRAPGTRYPAHALARLMHFLDDFNAFRDDAHMAAWRPLGVEGYVWEAFALVCSGQARTAGALFEQLAHRGYRRCEYAAALADLTRRGWLAPDGSAGEVSPTDTGRALRAAVERDTDRYFYAPWECLREEEIARCQVLLRTLSGG